MSRLDGPESESPVTDAGDIENLDSPATEDRETKLRRLRWIAYVNGREEMRLRAVRSLYRLLLAQGRYEVSGSTMPVRPADPKQPMYRLASRARKRAAGECVDCPRQASPGSCGATCVGRNERRQRNQEDNDHEFVSRKSVDQRG